MTDSFIESSLCEEDEFFEIPLRPQLLSEFKGQDIVKERLEIIIQAAKERKDPLPHCLLNGPPGLGKTTLANILAKAMGTQLITTSGPVIEKAGDLAGILTRLQEGDVLFIDEIHRLNRNIEEYLYPAMEDFVLDLVIDSGPSARTVKVNLKKFTLVGATTRSGSLSSPLRSRFGFSTRLDYYESAVLKNILVRSAHLLSLSIDEEGAMEIANRARGTPRIANNLLRWVRDYAQIHADNKIDKKVADKALSLLEIDHLGFDEIDRRILSVMIDHYDGGPVGLNTIAIAVGEEKHTIEEVHEPFLILQGFLKRTSRGREVTSLAYNHLGKVLK